ncbi:unannotated protein [freshwater metagenome]|uniref:Unannotated protein n=1 Tax=freshwater metagenome TaxID=449393 RepID=A0A6J7PK39_9ZZZZ|nr:CPBP family intramembrane metalloprotease [Actinomycetota bacterium]MSW11307.1 CPBP family intramembrane metalloprotease [Actinomycetota bacterium]
MIDTPPVKAARWGLWDVLITLGGALVLGVAAALVLDALSAPLAIQVLVGGMAPWLALAGWPLFITSVRGNGPRMDLSLSLSWRDAGSGLVGGVIAIIAAVVVALATAAIFGEFNSAAGDVGVELKALGDYWLLIAFGLMIAVGAPIAEELAFRGLFFAALRKHGVGPVLSVVITAVAFALFHLEPARLGVLVTIGLVLGIVRLRTGSLGASMVAHGVVNAPAAVILVIGLPGVAP